MLPPEKRLRWSKSYRLISTRYPPVDLFERVADPADWEALAAIEMLTNPRVRDQIGEISLVKPKERVSGPGASWIMAPFTHVGHPSRFSDGTWGVYYAAKHLLTAVKEKAFHVAKFLAATKEPLGTNTELRTLIAAVDSKVYDIRRGFEKEHHLEDYSAGQRLARKLREKKANGIVYRSVRHPPGGECLAAFRPRIVGLPSCGPHVRLRWDGQTIDRWFHFGDKLWRALGGSNS